MQEKHKHITLNKKNSRGHCQSPGIAWCPIGAGAGAICGAQRYLDM